MPDAVTLGWRQYRLERRMFWRNPSAAFFNFVLPLLFLAGGGAILSGSQTELDRLVPSIAGMRVMATPFSAFAYNIVFLRDRGPRVSTSDRSSRNAAQSSVGPSAPPCRRRPR